MIFITEARLNKFKVWTLSEKYQKNINDIKD